MRGCKSGIMLYHDFAPSHFCDMVCWQVIILGLSIAMDKRIFICVLNRSMRISCKSPTAKNRLSNDYHLPDISYYTITRRGCQAPSCRFLYHAQGLSSVSANGLESKSGTGAVGSESPNGLTIGADAAV